MLLPHNLRAMRLGCLRAPEYAPSVRQPAAVIPGPAAWSRGDAPRVTGHNDVVGDCVPTAACNAVVGARWRAGLTPVRLDDYALTLYSALTGYVRGRPSTDRGTDPAVLFKYWRARPIAGFWLDDVASIAPADTAQIRNAIRVAGGVLLVVALSVEQQNQRVWMPSGAPGSWGLHAAWADSFDGDLFFATSWGKATPIDASYFRAPGFVGGVYDLTLRQAA